jgi:hypothetical protein
MSINFSLKLKISLTSQQIKGRVYTNKLRDQPNKKAVLQESMSDYQQYVWRRETDEEEIN